MARTQRNDVDYFPHSVEHGKKMFYLRSKYKNDGYAVWFMLLEELGSAKYHYLDLKDEIQIMYLSSKFMVDEETIKEIIQVLVKFEEFDRELWESESILFNQKFIDNIKDAYKKRNNNCIDRSGLIDLLTAKGRIKVPLSAPKEVKGSLKGAGNTQSKLEYTKEEDSREEKSVSRPVSVGESEMNKRQKLPPALIGFRKNVFEEAKEQLIDDCVAEEFFKHWTAIDHNSGTYLFQATQNFAIPNRLKNWNEFEQKKNQKSKKINQW